MKTLRHILLSDTAFKSMIAIGLVGFAVLTRLLPHPPNFTSVAAVALFAGALLPRKWAIVVPTMTMVISDALIGFHSLIFVTWGAMVFSAVLSRLLLKTITAGRVVMTSIAASVVFFVVTNFAVWLEGLMYPPTLSGLIHCYYNAIPFFRNTLAGDIVFSLVLFGCYVAIKKYSQSFVSVHASSKV